MGTKVYGTYYWNASKTDPPTDSTANKRRPWFEYEVRTNSNDTYGLTLSGGLQINKTITPAMPSSTYGVYVTGTGKSSKYATKSLVPTTAQTATVVNQFTDWSWTKTHSSQTITITAYIRFNGVDSPGYKASKSFTIPARRSYAVTYNANGGVSAPASQTKWYGESLRLQKSVPGKIDSTSGLLYDFTGWNTSADGTGTMYQPGAAYTGNDALPLYAQWEPHYYPPVIQHYDVTRCDQNGNPEDEGEYAKVTFDCVINRWKHSGNTTLSAASVSIGSHTATPTITYSTDGYDTVCTCSAIVGDGSFSADATYTGSISVTDSSTGETLSTATANIVLNSAKFAIDMSANGRSIGIFKPASDTEDYLLDVGGKIQADDSVVIKTNSDSTTYPSSALYPKLIEAVDANGLPIGYIEGTLLTDGKNGVSLTSKRMISGTAKYNYLRLLVDDSGNPVVQVGASDPWKNAIITPSAAQSIASYITSTTGTFVSGQIVTCGKLAQLVIRVRNTSSTASGKDIYAGVLSQWHPVSLGGSGVNGVGYFGAVPVVGYMNTGGSIIIRNASPSAVTIGSSSTTQVTFTYLMQ